MMILSGSINLYNSIELLDSTFVARAGVGREVGA